MTKEQQAWYEYAVAKENWKRAREVWSRPDVCDGEPTHAAANKNLRIAITYAPSLWTAVAFRNYVAAHKKAMAWIPTRKRLCENCAFCIYDDDEPNGWCCECELIDSGYYAPDECNCAEWEPKTQEGGKQ